MVVHIAHLERSLRVGDSAPVVSVVIPLRLGDEIREELYAGLETFADSSRRTVEILAVESADNAGVNRNVGRRHVRAAYTLHLDADIALAPRTLYRWHRYLEATPEKCWAYGTFSRSGELSGTQGPVQISTGLFYTGNVCLIRTACDLASREDDESQRLEDRFYFSDLAAAGHSGTMIDSASGAPAYDAFYKLGDTSTPL